jgi:hypothetical protein
MPPLHQHRWLHILCTRQRKTAADDEQRRKDECPGQPPFWPASGGVRPPRLLHVVEVVGDVVDRRRLARAGIDQRDFRLTEQKCERVILHLVIYAAWRLGQPPLDGRSVAVDPGRGMLLQLLDDGRSAVLVPRMKTCPLSCTSLRSVCL